MGKNLNNYVIYDSTPGYSYGLDSNELLSAVLAYISILLFAVDNSIC